MLLRAYQEGESQSSGQQRKRIGMTVTTLVPSSLVREARDKREATRKLGYVARAATVFRIDRLVVFPDSAGERRWGGGFVRTVLAYAATPPYLRKEVWGRRDELEYVGVLPPLRAVTQTGSGSNGSGSLRQGIVTEVGSDGRVRVNCGLQHPISLVVPSNMTVDEGERVTIRVSSREPLRARIIDEPLPGISVERAELDTVIARPDAGLRIASSRYGEELTTSRLGDLHSQLNGEYTVAFGAPERGLPEILGVDRDTVNNIDASDETNDEPDRSRFDLWLNTVPNQGSETVRTEEAMFATLACLNLE
jgi:predicted SPOUT superfamily RNA methylase MTH1